MKRRIILTAILLVVSSTLLFAGAGAVTAGGAATLSRMNFASSVAMSFGLEGDETFVSSFLQYRNIFGKANFGPVLRLEAGIDPKVEDVYMEGGLLKDFAAEGGVSFRVPFDKLPLSLYIDGYFGIEDFFFKGHYAAKPSWTKESHLFITYGGVEGTLEYQVSGNISISVGISGEFLMEGFGYTDDSKNGREDFSNNVRGGSNTSLAMGASYRI